MISEDKRREAEYLAQDARVRAEYMRLCMEHSAPKTKDGVPIDRSHADFDPRKHCPRCQQTYDQPLGRMTFYGHDCGCEVVGNGTLPQPVRILFCRMHQSASEADAAERQAALEGP